MADMFSRKAADNFRLARSLTLTSLTDATTYNIIQLPRYAFVADIWLDVVVAAVGGSPILTIGFIGNGETADPDGFMMAATSNIEVTGMKRASMGAAAFGRGKWFSAASGVITVYYDSNGATTLGTFRVFCQYSVIL